MIDNDYTITTTNGESFTYQESCNLAFQIYKRFGRNMESAHKAWMRLLENNCSFSNFQKLVLTGKGSFEDSPAVDICCWCGFDNGETRNDFDCRFCGGN